MYWLLWIAIRPFPASGSPSAGFASKCERRQGKPCRVLIAIPLPSEKAPRFNSFMLRRDVGQEQYKPRSCVVLSIYKLIAEWSLKTRHKTCRQQKRCYFRWFLPKATLFVLGGTGEVEFDIKRGNSGVLAGFGLFLPDISRFPQAGVPRLDLQANANDGKASLAAYLSRYLWDRKSTRLNSSHM